jgi:hypothetical protein
MKYDGHKLEASLPRKTRNYSFIVEVYDDWRLVVLRDISRGYKAVATIRLPESIRTKQKARDLFLRAATRDVLRYYKLQHTIAERGITYTPESFLSVEELKAGVGLSTREVYGEAAKAAAAPAPAQKKNNSSSAKRRREVERERE